MNGLLDVKVVALLSTVWSQEKEKEERVFGAGEGGSERDSELSGQRGSHLVNLHRGGGMSFSPVTYFSALVVGKGTGVFNIR